MSSSKVHYSILCYNYNNNTKAKPQQYFFYFPIFKKIIERYLLLKNIKIIDRRCHNIDVGFYNARQDDGRETTAHLIIVHYVFTFNPFSSFIPYRRNNKTKTVFSFVVRRRLLFDSNWHCTKRRRLLSLRKWLNAVLQSRTQHIERLRERKLFRASKI